MKIDYYTPAPLRPGAITTLKRAKEAVFGDNPVTLVPGDAHASLALDNDFLMRYPLADVVLEHRLRGLHDHPFGPKTLYLDIESMGVEDRWRLSARDFFRLGQYAIGDGEVQLTTSYDEVVALVREAPGTVVHNGHSFDFSVLLGDEALDLARANRLLDTMTHANLALPAPNTYLRRDGRKMIHADKPANARAWLSLDNLSFQLGLKGKEGDLKALAAKYLAIGPDEHWLSLHEGIPQEQWTGFGMIPVDDPEFLQYAVQDVEALRDLTTVLLRIMPMDDYAWREQLCAAIDAQTARNGFRLDIPAAKARADMLSARKDVLVTELQEKYGLPVEGKQPWRSNVGKDAIWRALKEYGVVPDEDWPLTKGGAYSLGGEVLIEMTTDTDAAELGQALAELMGQRSLPQLALDCVQPDGRVHPEIDARQRSGRKSITEPGLTVWGSHEGRDIDKEYFIASEGCSLVTMDYSAADARVVAAYSGDEEFARRFEEGVDAHSLTGEVFFGYDEYYANKETLRPKAKAGGHALSYGVGPRKLAITLNLPLELTEQMVANYRKAYPDLHAWQREVIDEAVSTGFITSACGRRMVVDKGRESTQAVALLGQGGTAEILRTGLIRCLERDERLIKWLVATVHDEGIWDIPDEHLEWAVPAIKECMTQYWGVKMIMEFPVGVGTPAKNWRLASHG